MTRTAFLEKLTHQTPQDPRGAALYRSTDKVLRENRERLRADLPKAHETLWAAIGRPQTRALHTQ
jgi:hypothetical protein